MTEIYIAFVDTPGIFASIIRRVIKKNILKDLRRTLFKNKYKTLKVKQLINKDKWEFKIIIPTHKSKYKDTIK